MIASSRPKTVKQHFLCRSNKPFDCELVISFLTMNAVITLESLLQYVWRTTTLSLLLLLPLPQCLQQRSEQWCSDNEAAIFSDFDACCFLSLPCGPYWRERAVRFGRHGSWGRDFVACQSVYVGRWPPLALFEKGEVLMWHVVIRFFWEFAGIYSPFW